MKKFLACLAVFLASAWCLTAQEAAPATASPDATAVAASPAPSPVPLPSPASAPSAAPTAAPAASSAPAASAAPSAAPTAAPVASPAPGASPVAEASPSAAPVQMGTTQTARYTVLSELGQDSADLTAKTLEAWFDLYNSYFHFDPATLKARLQVRIFATKATFDAYLTSAIGSTKDDFVYLHYPTPEKCELLVWAKDDKADYQLSLAHQAFVQYLKAFAPGAPLWLREGFAIYFEASPYDPATGAAAYTENLSWLDTVKTYRSEGSLMPLDTFLALSADQAREQLQVFYPESWAFVSFLLGSEDKSVNRLLWDAISRLGADPDASATEQRLFDLASKWPGVDALSKAFNGYLDGKKTFPEMVQLGIQQYNDKKYDEAKKTLDAAVAMDGTSYVPFYYRGLVSYYLKDYASAESDYQKALQLGCDAGIGNYALGVNAFIAGQGSSAKDYLAKAKAASPDVYGPKADEVLARIK